MVFLATKSLWPTYMFEMTFNTSNKWHLHLPRHCWSTSLLSISMPLLCTDQLDNDYSKCWKHTETNMMIYCEKIDCKKSMMMKMMIEIETLTSTSYKHEINECIKQVNISLLTSSHTLHSTALGDGNILRLSAASCWHDASLIFTTRRCNRLRSKGLIQWTAIIIIIIIIIQKVTHMTIKLLV